MGRSNIKNVISKQLTQKENNLSQSSAFYIPHRERLHSIKTSQWRSIILLLLVTDMLSVQYCLFIVYGELIHIDSNKHPEGTGVHRKSPGQRGEGSESVYSIQRCV